MAVLLATPLQALAAPGGPTGAIVIAGNGPELLMMERLARSFEKEHPGTAVDIEWESTSDPIAMLQSGAASYAVTGERIAGLAAIPIAWDGIAVVVYAAHSIRDLTSGQLAAMFTSETSSWPDGNGHETTIRILNRPLYQNIRQRFEEALNIVGRIPPEAPIVRSDQEALSRVAGSFSAVAFVSLKPALEAVAYGVAVTLLTVDGVPAANETVRDGRYPLRRPVLLLARGSPTPAGAAFAAFALSPEGQRIVGDFFTAYGVHEGTEHCSTSTVVTVPRDTQSFCERR